MKINLLYNLLICFSLFACSKEESPEPSYADVEWFVVKNDPNADALDQLRYKIFAETGVPIFYSDTLGSQERVDRYGDSYTYYEVCAPGYVFTSDRAWKYSLSKDRDQLLEMLKLMDDYVMPLLRPETKPRSFLIVDTLKSGKDFLSIQMGMMTTLVSMHPVTNGGVAVSEMTEEEKQEYGVQLAGVRVTDYLMRFCKQELKPFYDVSEVAFEPEMSSDKTTKGKSCYGDTDVGRYIYKLVVPNSNPVQYIVKPSYDFGFFSFRSIGSKQYQTVSKHTDLMEFMSRISLKTDAEIREEIKEWPLIIEKYEILLEKLHVLGLEAWIKDK